MNRHRITRRGLVATALAAPLIRHAHAADAIKIGMPLALTGPLGSVGQEQKNGAELWAKVTNAKGGLLGRPIQLFITDTGGDPATCVRKAQELVERDNCHVFFGMTLSSEALAVVPKLAEWNAIFVSSDNGDGRLTGSSLVPNFFGVGTLPGGMGFSGMRWGTGGAGGTGAGLRTGGNFLTASCGRFTILTGRIKGLSGSCGFARYRAATATSACNATETMRNFVKCKCRGMRI